jgi:dTMP kinase
MPGTLTGPTGPTIIAIEGLDASGKTTQAALLAEALRNDGTIVGTLSFPRYDSFFGRRIGALLRGDDPTTANNLDPRSMALWFAMDRWDAVRHEMPVCDVLLINRWTLSNAVYQGARAVTEAASDDVFDWVLELEFGQLGLPQPSLTILLDLSVDTSMARARDRAADQGSTPDVYESHAHLLASSRRLYRRAASQGHGLIVDAEHRTAPDIHQTVIDLVRQL